MRESRSEKPANGIDRSEICTGDRHERDVFTSIIIPVSNDQIDDKLPITVAYRVRASAR